MVITRKRKQSFHLKLKVKNHGQSPASIEKTYVWIENILENSKNLVIWNANELYARKKFVLFQNEEEELNLKIYLGKSDMDKIKNKKQSILDFISYTTHQGSQKIYKMGHFTTGQYIDVIILFLIKKVLNIGS